MLTLFDNWSQNKVLLIAGNLLLGGVLILLEHASLLPLDLENFVFFSFVVLLLALYRPGWTFLFLVGMLPFEIINIAPVGVGITLRPYQWIALLLAFSLLLRLITRRLPFEIVRPRWFDYLLLLIPFGAFVAITNAPVHSVALKQAVILLSFGLVYALCRQFLQSRSDIRQTIPFFASSSLVVLVYALWQNLRSQANLQSFEVMAGRPNATFSEADWLGLFTVLVLGASYLLVHTLLSSGTPKAGSDQNRNIWRRPVCYPEILVAFGATVLTLLVLIITVSRSAWLGAVVVTIIFFLGIIIKRGIFWIRDTINEAILFGAMVIFSFLTALSIVSFFHLSAFHLLNRVGSTASGLQEITVACERDTVLPKKIETLEELASLGCRHILLEDIEREKTAGRFVKIIARDDPNIVSRKNIYATVLHLLRQHPVLGIGWGSVSASLGTDARGSGLNASNLFLEIWLGSGIIGLIAFLVFWFWLAFRSLSVLFGGNTPRSLLALFVLASWGGMTVFNLFNSGILLGFFFAFLALGAMILQNDSEKEPE